MSLYESMESELPVHEPYPLNVKEHKRFSLVRVDFGQVSAKVSKFWFVVKHYIQTVRMMRDIVLMVGLRGIKGTQRNYLSYDRTLENFGLLQLRDIRIRNALLFVVSIKDGGTILGAVVRSLPVQLSGIVRHGKEHLKELPICDL